MTDAEIINAWEKVLATGDAPVGEHWGCSVTTNLAKETFDMLNRQKAEIERLTEELDGETTEIMRLKHEVERLEKQENTVAKLYHKKGVKDFAYFLIDKAEGTTINVLDIPDYVAEMEGEENAKE